MGDPWLTLAPVALGVIMVTLDGTVVAIANPVISKDLGASLADLQWVTNGYLLALAVSLITAGKLGDRFGHKPVFLIGVAGFALSSAGIGFSTTIGMVIALRVVQGLFGAMLQPTALGLLRAAFPAERLNMAIGLWGACIAASTASGPIVGGLLVQHVNWESVFFINVPAYGWADAKTLAFFGGAVVLLVLFVAREHLARQPLLPLTLFRSVSLSVGVVLMMLMAFGMFRAMFFLTFYLQSVHGLSPVATGVRLLPMMLAMMVAPPIGGGMISKLGPRAPLVVGNAPVALSGVAGGLQQVAMQVGGALGTSVLGAVLTAKVAGVLPGHMQDAGLPAPAPAQVDLMKGAISQGVAPVPKNTPPQVAELIIKAGHLSFIDGMHLAFVVSAVMAFIAALLSLLVRAGRQVEGAAIHI
ncbi:MFS transporter [Actinoallomurus spadix]|uniref:MFS transporter n=1 Tax=Actinoallomurus spadix TaxID=79912 RepID=A0ABP3HJF4_9ACTN|nr:MFS transporter [Actinoallomurus spadix]MCO5991123.1 MFS transporter [Actinoallomurus spadix]